MAWAKVNLLNSQEIDNVIKISGLHSILNNTNAYMILNVCVNGLKRQLLPDGHDVYILGFWHEVFDEEWFIKNYEKHHHAQFIILGDFLPNELEKYNRVEFVRLLHWQYFTSSVTDSDIDWSQKKYKISSLSYYVNEFRYFVTAALLETSDNLISWHNEQRSYGNYEYIFEKTGYPNRDNLIQFKDRLINKIEIDKINNDPVYNYQQAKTLPAYRETLVNCINETKDVSWVDNFGDCPGPYLTEKTWKPLYTGTALIFVGQHNIKNVLEQAGFIFDYPWNNQYTDIPGDLERLEKIIETINYINEMPFDTILNGIKESCEYNKNYLYSNDFKNYINNINNTGLQKLEKILK